MIYLCIGFTMILAAANICSHLCAECPPDDRPPGWGFRVLAFGTILVTAYLFTVALVGGA